MVSILGIAMAVSIVIVIAAKYLTTIRIQTLKHTVVDSETASRAALGRLKAAENEKLIAERNEQISIRKKEGLEKQIEKLTKELGTLNV